MKPLRFYVLPVAAAILALLSLMSLSGCSDAAASISAAPSSAGIGDIDFEWEETGTGIVFTGSISDADGTETVDWSYGTVECRNADGETFTEKHLRAELWPARIAEKKEECPEVEVTMEVTKGGPPLERKTVRRRVRIHIGK